MTDERHIRTDEYADGHSRLEARKSLALRLHRHLIQSCSGCAAEWDLLADDQQKLMRLLAHAAAAPGASREVPADLLSCYSEEVRLEEEDLSRVRRIRHDARIQTWHLQKAPPDARNEKVEAATAQYRSRAVAEFLLERCRQTVRDDPTDARSLAAAVPVVLEAIPEAAGQPWAADLHALSRAWHANAVRVAGDLPAADRAFARLRLDLASHPVYAPDALAEIMSLEASLRIAQRRVREAARLLDQAGLLFRVVGDRDGEVRVLIKYGNLLMDLAQPEESLQVFEQAASFLGRSRADGHYLCCSVNGRIVALCDLGRLDEAEELLQLHLDLFEDHLNSGAIVRSLQARIHLGRGQLDAAGECFRDSCEAFLAAGLFSDAAMVCLDLAGTYLKAGELDRLRRLLQGILPLLRARGVDQDVLTVVQLLARATAADKLSRTVLADLRRSLAGRPPSSVST